MSVFSPEASTPLTLSQVRDLGVLTIHSHGGGDTHVLALYGELDLATAGDVRVQLHRAESAARAGTAIVIDLRGLTFIDSTGLRMLVEAGRRADAATHRLRLVQPSDDVFRVCRIAGIDALLPFESASDEADA